MTIDFHPHIATLIIMDLKFDDYIYSTRVILQYSAYCPIDLPTNMHRLRLMAIVKYLIYDCMILQVLWKRCLGFGK